jgi:hypothetical protein
MHGGGRYRTGKDDQGHQSRESANPSCIHSGTLHSQPHLATPV